MQVPADEDLKYRRKQGTDAYKGHTYEVRLEMLFLLEGIMKYKARQIVRFYLASNMDGVGKFDDIVFKYDYNCNNDEVRRKAIFLQAKHKGATTNFKILRLPGDLDDKQIFNVEAYFESYKNERQIFDLEDNNHENRTYELILYTNASPEEQFFHINRDCYVEDENILSCTGRTCYKLLKNIVREKELEDFVDKLKIYVQQPNIDELERMLKQKIESTYSVMSGYVRYIFLDIQDMLEKRAGYEDTYLTENCTFFEDAIGRLFSLSFLELHEK